jgi:signal transduction histidine kinase
MLVGGPGPHGGERSRPALDLSSAVQAILRRRGNEPSSSFGMTRRSSGRRTKVHAERVTISGPMPGTPSSLVARARALPPFRLDLLLGAFILVDGVLETLLLSELEGARLFLGFAVAALVAVAVTLRRRLPILAIGIGWGAMLIADNVGRDLIDHVAGPYFANMFVTFTAGYVLEGRRLVAAGVLGTSLTILATATDDYRNTIGNFVMSAGLGVLGPMLLGQVLRNRTRLNEALREKAEQAAHERAREAEDAALEERTRIAGELHDVVAHALSAMTVQAGAARRLTERDPEQARAAFAAAESTGREALTELRRLLGVLRKQDEELALAPQPSLAHAAELVRRAAAAGLPTELHTEGERRALPAGVDLTAYRLVQEALRAARDAGQAGRAEVSIRFRAEDVLVEVADDGGHDGRRLLGMSERVAVYGGELLSVAMPSGGWRVAARLPLEAGA